MFIAMKMASSSQTTHLVCMGLDTAACRFICHIQQHEQRAGSATPEENCVAWLPAHNLWMVREVDSCLQDRLKAFAVLHSAYIIASAAAQQL